MPDETSPARPESESAARARKEKLALDRLSLARTFALAANRVFLIFFVSLALLWQQRVLPDLQATRNVERARIRFLNSRFAAVADDQGAVRLVEGDGRQAQTLEQQWQEQANAARSSPWKLFGFDLPVPVYYSALVWTLLFLVLLAYLIFIRRRHFFLVGRALRILRSDAGYSSDDLSDLSPGLPWWLVPVPGRDGAVIRSSDLIAAAGWQASYRRLHALQVCAFVALVALQLFTGWVSWRVVSTLAAQAKAEQFVLLELTLVVQVLTLACLYEWMRPTRVSDQLSHQESPNGWNRRNVFSVGIATAFAVVVHPTANVVASYAADVQPTRRGNPRFRRDRRRANSAPATYAKDGLLNQRTGTLHYVKSGTRQHTCLTGIAPDHVARMKAVEFVATLMAPSPRPPVEADVATSLESSDAARDRRLQPIAAPPIHVHSGCAVWAVEHAVEDLLHGGSTERPAQAAELLVRAIRGDRQNLRLYDRLAVLTLKYDLPTHRAELLRLAMNQVKEERSRESRVQSTGRVDEPRSIGAGTPPSLWIDLLNRALGVRSAPVTKSSTRQRHRCVGGTRRPRTGRRMKPSMAAALEARLAAWQNPTSGWRKRWAAAERQWQSPRPASPCRLT